jgi:hypothetical protein
MRVLLGGIVRHGLDGSYPGDLEGGREGVSDMPAPPRPRVIS